MNEETIKVLLIEDNPGDARLLKEAFARAYSPLFEITHVDSLNAGLQHLAWEDFNVVFCQLAPWQFDYRNLYNLKRTFRRTSYLITRLLANLGAAGATPILGRFQNPVDTSKPEKRWLEGLYLDVPQEWDDPYRFFRW